jgi:hypothetical protein
MKDLRLRCLLVTRELRDRCFQVVTEGVHVALRGVQVAVPGE